MKKLIRLMTNFFVFFFLLNLTYAGSSSDFDGDFQLDLPQNIPSLDSFNASPISKFVTRDQFDAIADKALNKVRNIQGNVLTIDTRKQEACHKIKNSLELNFPHNNYAKLCKKDEQQPFVSIYNITDNSIEYRNYISPLPEFNDPRMRHLTKESRNLLGLGLLTFGFIYALPEDVSNWHDRNFGQNYVRNIKEGPIVDKDHWFINYIGHPMSGAVYHIVARNAGFSPMQSFGYSAFMSTFFWEYGLEAFAETPSIQDLIITPIIGSLMGEVFYRSIQSINKNDGILWGSKRLGSIAKGIMDPSLGLRKWINKKLDSKFIKSSRTYFYTKDFSSSFSHETPNANNFRRDDEIGN
jgi:hypothetical protein